MMLRKWCSENDDDDNDGDDNDGDGNNDDGAYKYTFHPVTPNVFPPLLIVSVLSHIPGRVAITFQTNKSHNEFNLWNINNGSFLHKEVSTLKNLRRQKKPENNANKVDIAVMDKEKKRWLLIEGTVCGVGLISDRRKLKQDKYRELRAGIKQLYPDYKVTQVNIVFDFLAGYHQSMKNELDEHLTDKNEDETQYLIMKSQKWIMSQNVEIVKYFYTYKV